MMKKKEIHVIGVLCGMFFAVCLLNLFGISLGFETDETARNAGETTTVKDVGDALACVNSSIEKEANVRADYWTDFASAGSGRPSS